MSTSMPDSPRASAGLSSAAGATPRAATTGDAGADTGAEAPPLQAGTVVADRYRVVELLGEGGMGAVYRVEHVHMRKQMALKVLHASMCGTQEVVARFEREAIAAGHIQHPNVVSASDFGKLPDGSFFLVLELVEGQSLRKLLTEGRVAPMRAVRIVQQIGAALGAAHAKGVVHRDLKPENVMVVERPADNGVGTEECVKVLDFGIAKVDVEIVSAGNVGASGSGAGGQPLTRIGAVFGTPDYMSPEQAMGQGVDARSDLYSIGIIFYELLTGERPFRGGVVTVLRQHVLEDVPPLPLDVVAQLDPRVVDVLARLLAKTPEARLATADELCSTLGEVIARPEAPPPPTVVDPHVPTLMAGMAGVASPNPPHAAPSGTMIVGLDAPSFRGGELSPPMPPVRNPSDDRARPAWALFAGLAVAAILGVLFVGIVLHKVFAKGDADASDPSSTSGSRATAKVTAPIDLPPPPPPASTGAGRAGGTGSAAASSSSSPEDEQRAAAGSTASSTPKETKGANKKGRKTGPFGIYIPPPKEW
jgi:serine/threonine-protein kinase